MCVTRLVDIGKEQYCCEVDVDVVDMSRRLFVDDLKISFCSDEEQLVNPVFSQFSCSDRGVFSLVGCPAVSSFRRGSFAKQLRVGVRNVLDKLRSFEFDVSDAVVLSQQRMLFIQNVTKKLGIVPGAKLSVDDKFYSPVTSKSKCSAPELPFSFGPLKALCDVVGVGLQRAISFTAVWDEGSRRLVEVVEALRHNILVVASLCSWYSQRFDAWGKLTGFTVAKLTVALQKLQYCLLRSLPLNVCDAPIFEACFLLVNDSRKTLCGIGQKLTATADTPLSSSCSVDGGAGIASSVLLSKYRKQQEVRPPVTLDAATLPQLPFLLSSRDGEDVSTPIKSRDNATVNGRSDEKFDGYTNPFGVTPSGCGAKFGPVEEGTTVEAAAEGRQGPFKKKQRRELRLKFIG
ncbi:uncharacterized protein TEOVI_000498000 [Trypanosoma equiperdum]|uniref:Uncharacterized protein n=1 Tax=Trypanosoma equiperdum TaxID=5694 RepID=A0A1G4ILF7_TRYEQ|nr:hypothetical protein, conserved [Trypanosoma equiperdum]